MRIRYVLAAASALAVLSAAGCSARTSPVTAATPEAAPVATVRTAAPAAPDTSAAARAATTAYMALYSAGQWAAAWQYLTTADKKIAPESLYTAAHARCLGATEGMAFEIKAVAMAGKIAVITYTIPVLASLGSATIAMTWTRDGWKADLGSSDEALYRHGSLKSDLAAMKAAGDCSGS